MLGGFPSTPAGCGEGPQPICFAEFRSRVQADADAALWWCSDLSLWCGHCTAPLYSSSFSSGIEHHRVQGLEGASGKAHSPDPSQGGPRLHGQQPPLGLQAAGRCPPGPLAFQGLPTNQMSLRAAGGNLDASLSRTLEPGAGAGVVVLPEGAQGSDWGGVPPAAP